MLRSTKKIQINKGKFDQVTIILYAQVKRKTFVLNNGEESLTIECETFYYENDDLKGLKIIDELISFSLNQEEQDVYFEKFSSDKIKFREVLNNMLDYLAKDLIVERYAGYIESADLETFYTELGKK